MKDWHEPYYDYPCCSESCIVVYHHGFAVSHCYRGTRQTWERADASRYFALTSSYMIVGARADD